ncbi:hypothetical protein [Parabacteroides sp.]
MFFPLYSYPFYTEGVAGSSVGLSLFVRMLSSSNIRWTIIHQLVDDHLTAGRRSSNGW